MNGDYVLLNDLDDKTAGYNEHVSGRAAGFEPIMTFEGAFDGQGNEIGGLEINRPAQSNIGLFGVSEGTIENVVVTDANITGGDRRVGGLLGLLSDGGEVLGSTVRNTTITGNKSVGGIVGEDFNNTSKSVLESIVRNTTVTGDNLVGGLVGALSGGVAKSVIHDTTVTGEGFSIGGLVGESTGKVSASAVRYGDISGQFNVGGLVGALFDTTEGSASEVVASFAAGEVSAEQTVGGIVGANQGAITASYWDTETTTQDTGTGKGGGDMIGLRTEEMQGDAATSNMPALDFDVTWNVATAPDDYPILTFENTVEVTNVDISPEEVDGTNETHTLTFNVANLSADGGKDDFMITLPDGVEVDSVSIVESGSLNPNQPDAKNPIGFMVDPSSGDPVEASFVVELGLSPSTG